jgi:hypothetical protein
VAKATYNQQLLDRATAYVEQPLTARRGTEAGLSELTALYSAISGEAAGTCRQCQVSDFMAVVTAYIREATRFLYPETVQDSNYTFAPAFANEQIADGRYDKVVTAETLTDADAEKLIKMGYGHVIVKKGGEDAAATAEGSTDGSTQTLAVTQADLEAEQTAHQATTKRLEEAQAVHTADKQKSSDSLKAEKDAHTATKKELTASKKQVTDLTKELADVQKQLGDVQKLLADATKPAATDVVTGEDAK